MADDDFNLTEQMKIYLQKEESIFEKYGDEEAQLYYDLQAHEQAMRDQREKDGGGYRNNKR